MAHTTDGLNVHRSVMLLRCQRGREGRCHIDVIRAEQAHNAAAAAETLAKEQLDTYRALHAKRLHEAHDAVRGRTVDLHALKRITALEQDLQNKAIAMQSTLTEAREIRRAAALALARASTELQMQVKATHRRERLARELSAAWSRATEAGSETEREEQAIDNWNSE